jgi:Zn-dependent M28 family amino/carboxypeptidase
LEPAHEPGVRRIFFAAAVLAGIFLLTRAAEFPPGAKPTTAPTSEFSADRAFATLEQLLGTRIPHPLGSPANEQVRERVVRELKLLGYEPQVQTAFDCGEFGACATVNNVLVRIPGIAAGPAVLLSAHYDSVAAGPGAFDDGAGVAVILEIARALKSLPPTRNTIILLINDGEEAGLLGARAFVDQYPWAREVRAAINVDARGTSGPSMMFETGRANDWVVGIFAKAARRPSTTSVFYTVYKQLPNDTDFTIFKSAGYEGLNFAIIGDPVHYHTPLDNLDNADPSSLQHQGENAFESLLALANADLVSPRAGEAVYFDLFQRWVIRWPARSALPLAEFAAVLLCFEIAWMIWKKRMRLAECLWGLGEWLVMVVVVGLLAWILTQILHRAGAVPVDWPAHSMPLVTAFWWLAISVVITHGMLFARRATFWGSWAGGWIWWALLAILASWHEPGLSYLFVVPALVAGLTALLFTFRRSESSAGFWLAAFLPLAASALVSFPAILQLFVALGHQALVLIAVAVTLMLTPAAPLCRDLRKAGGLTRLVIPLGPIGITVLAAFAAIVLPAYSAKAPEHSNMDYWLDSDSGKSEWIVFPESKRLEESIRLATQFHRLDRGPFPWSTEVSFVADAPHVDLPPPTFTVQGSSEAGGKRQFRALLRSERGAEDAMVLFPPDCGVDSVRVNDLLVEPETEPIRRYLNGWSIYESFTTPAKGVEISFTLPIGKPIEVQVLDEVSGLPPEGLFLLKARPLTATPFSNGDLTVVSRRVQLLP